MKNVIIFEDLMLIINLGDGALGLIEGQDLKVSEDSQEVVHAITFAFTSGLAKQVKYTSKEARDESFQAITKMIKNQGSSGISPSGIVGVGIKPSKGFNGRLESR